MSGSDETRVYAGWVVTGFVVGLIIAATIMLFRAPQSGRMTRRQITASGDSLRDKLEAAVPSDPIAESMAEGKAAAQRRRAELGLR
jgi:gas vesicle protein